MDYYIVGLGNPGKKYERTRHNVAWIVLHHLYDLDWEYDKYLSGDVATTTKENHTLHYLLPQTFMNLSGTSVRTLKSMYSSFTPERLIVLYDDLDLPLGTVRISFDRGSGGHNGIRSIIEHLGSEAFIRIRIGIAKTLADGRTVKPPVLGPFEHEEYQRVIQDIAPQVQTMITTIANEGYQAAMNSCNKK